jgi:hypothetical protein
MKTGQSKWDGSHEQGAQVRCVRVCVYVCVQAYLRVYMRVSVDM